MSEMNKFDPNEIPNMVSVLVGIYSDRRQPTAGENQQINQFFMRYMGKAMEDCQGKSSGHWQVARPQSDIAFETKVVDIPGHEPGFVTQFIVATTACMASNLEQFDEFKRLTQEKILDTYADDSKFQTIYNKLAFNGSPDLANNKRSLVRSLWIGCRLSEAHFVEKKPAEAANDAPAN